MAFPCNDFEGQEPAEIDEILEFAKEKYDANFEIFDKVKFRWAQIFEKNFEKFQKFIFDVFQRWYSKLGFWHMDFKIFDKVKFFHQVQVQISSRKNVKNSKFFWEKFEKLCLDHYGTSTLSIFGRSDKNWARMEFLEVYHSTIWNRSTGISTLGKTTRIWTISRTFYCRITWTYWIVKYEVSYCDRKKMPNQCITV